MRYRYNHFNANQYEAHQIICSLITDHSRVLDIGCATGYFAKELLKKKCETWGIDNNKEAIQKASQYCHKVITRNLNDDHVLPVPKKYFDYIILVDVIEHLLQPENILSLITSHLKKNGKIIISTPNIAHASIRWMMAKGEFQYTTLGIMDSTHLHFYTRKSLCDLLRKCNLKIEQLIPTNGMCKVPLLSKITDRLPLSLQYQIVKKFPTLFSYQFIAQTKLL